MCSNPVADQLRSAAACAPFKLEKENYLMAAAEIDRLHLLLHDNQHRMIATHVVEEICKLLTTCAHSSVRAAELLHMLNDVTQ